MNPSGSRAGLRSALCALILILVITDVVTLAPAQMVTADMWPDNPGTWLFHCHISEHMEAGMGALYQVLL